MQKADGTEADLVKIDPAKPPEPVKMAKHQRFVQPQNLLGVLFLGILAFNLLVMGIDFPRFTIVAVLLVILLVVFILLWIGAYFDYDLMEPARKFFGSIYAVANSGFYYVIAGILALNFAIIYSTRWLNYWEILPNEILHHHGPLSDLERFPTTNLKFDKEIPDVFEYLFLGAGRLVLHVTEERKAIVLDNVLFIGTKENALKRLMSRMEVRVTTDQEIDVDGLSLPVRRSLRSCAAASSGRSHFPRSPCGPLGADRESCRVAAATSSAVPVARGYGKGRDATHQGYRC